jgi:uncharacterized protein (TIGR02466 family)
MASSFEDGNLAQLFATPVWSFTPRRSKALAEQLGACLQQLRSADPRRAVSEARGMWQSRADLHEREEFAELVSLIHEASRSALALLQVECELRLTGLWGNISRGAHELHEHTHPNNYLSGVFYVRMPEGAGAIAFKDPRPQTRVMRPRTLAENPLNSFELEYTAEAGTMLLFPAWLEHGVRPSTTDEERISVAWNLMIHGPLGSNEQLAYSEL